MTPFSSSRARFFPWPLQRPRSMPIWPWPLPAIRTLMTHPCSTKPRWPTTWPGQPILFDSPGCDGVMVGLRVHADMHNPLRSVAKVFKVASGDLSLPGRVGP